MLILKLETTKTTRSVNLTEAAMQVSNRLQRDSNAVVAADAEPIRAEKEQVSKLQNVHI
jgi:hypothetical protein